MVAEYGCLRNSVCSSKSPKEQLKTHRAGPSILTDAIIGTLVHIFLAVDPGEPRGTGAGVARGPHDIMTGGPVLARSTELSGSAASALQ